MYIKNIEQSVTDYVSELRGSGYKGVRLKDILQMSSGVRLMKIMELMEIFFQTLIVLAKAWH